MKTFISTLLFFVSLNVSAVSNGWQFGIGVGYSLNYLVTLSGTGVSSGVPYSQSYLFEFTPATSIQFDFRKLNKNSWGMVGGFEYEAAREMSKLVSNGTSIPVTGSGNAKFQTHFLHYGAAYRWDIFYIPIQLAYGLTKFTPAVGSTVASSADNGIGAYFGFGWYIEDDLTIEYVSRSATTTLKFSAGSDNETTSGVLGSAVLGIKHFF